MRTPIGATGATAPTAPTDITSTYVAAGSRQERIEIVADLVHRVAGAGHPLMPTDSSPDAVLDRTFAWAVRRLGQTPAAMSDRFVTPHQFTRAAAS